MNNVVFPNRNFKEEKFNRIFRIKKFDIEKKHSKESKEFHLEHSNNLNSSITIDARIELKQKQLRKLSKVWIEALIESFDKDMITEKDSYLLNLKFKSFFHKHIEREKNGLKSALISYGLHTGAIISDFQSSIANELNQVKNISLDILKNEIENHNNDIENLNERKINKIAVKEEAIFNKKQQAINIMKKISRAEIEELNKLTRMAERYITSSHKIKGSTVQRWSKRTLNWLKRNYTETDYPNNFLLIPEPNHSSKIGLSSTDVNRIQKKLSILLETQGKNGQKEKVKQKPEVLKNIFIVHGRDNSIKEEVARFIEKLNLEPIILHELPNKGRTVIEKFIAHSDVGFAIILLTPDDKGGLAGDAIRNYKLRARQNVIFELGYFIGKLGRDKVCALYSSSVEIPSDYSGILFIEIDSIGSWKLNLAKEIKSSGIKLNLNNVM